MELLTPVAPPANAMQPVAPVVAAPAPVAVAPVVQTTVTTPKTNDLVGSYVTAVESGDPKIMATVVEQAKGTPLETKVDNAYKIMVGNDRRLTELTKPVFEAGGINTPSGNLAASKVFEDQSDNPQWMRAIAEKLMGNPNARLFITGGTPKTEITYDDQGNQLEETRNELGKRLSVKDVRTGKLLTPEEYANRGGGITDREQTMARIASKQEQTFNVTAANKANEQALDFAAASPELSNLASETTNLNIKLMGSNLSAADKAELASFTSRQIGDTQNVSSGFNALDQFTKSKGVGMDSSTKQAAKAGASLLGLTLNGDGSLTNSKNQAVSRSELDQLQKNYSSSRNFEQTFNQTQQNAIQSKFYKNMNEEQQKDFNQILLNNKRLEQKTAELIAKHGTPSFIINPTATGVFDNFSQGAGQGVIAQFNAAAMQEYAGWRNEQLAAMKKFGQIPTAGQLEAAFVRTAEYQSLMRKFEDEAWRIKTTTESSVKSSKSSNLSTEAVGGLKPPSLSNASPESTPASPRANAEKKETLDAIRARNRK